MINYSIWIEAEQWSEGEWNKNNDNTDVIVKLENGTSWIASFFTYNNINKLTEKNKLTGECLWGKYFWSSNMLLVDEVSRERIEEIVGYLLQEGKFESIFCECEDEI